MSKQVQKEVIELTREALVPLGYRKRSEGIFTREINKETPGRIGMNYSDGWGRSPVMDVNPIIGVRNHAIEEVYNEIMADEWRRTGYKRCSYASTLRDPLGYLMPERRYRTWEYEEGSDHTLVIRDMLNAIVTYGHPFMEAYASLPAITEALMDPACRYAELDVASLRRPIAYYLMGDYDRALALLDHPKCIDAPDNKEKLRQRIEQAKQGISPKSTTSSTPPADRSREPSATPLPEAEASPLEIRHRETGAVLLRLEKGIEFRANLRGVDLRGADLSGIQALGPDFRRANLAGASLIRAELTGADLRDADLTGANLHGVKIDTANAHRVNLSGADLRDARLERCLMHRAKLAGADLRGATLSQVDLTQAKLQGADLWSTKCPDSYFYGADLREAKLEGVELSGGEVIGRSRYDGKTRWPEGFDPEAHGATTEVDGPGVLLRF